MSTDIIDLTTLAKMAEAGIALTANAVRRDNGWVVLIRCGTDQRGVRELIASEPHGVAYRNLPATVEILRVKHTEQQWP